MGVYVYYSIRDTSVSSHEKSFIRDSRNSVIFFNFSSQRPRGPRISNPMSAQRCASAPSELFPLQNSCGSHVRVWDLVSCPAAAPIREGRLLWSYARHCRLCNFRNWAPEVRLALMLWPDSFQAFQARKKGQLGTRLPCT